MTSSTKNNPNLLVMSKNLSFVLGLAATGVLVGMGAIANAIFPQPAIAAEEIRLAVGGPISLSVSVDSLEKFAETGEIEQDLRLLTRFMSQKNKDDMQRALQTPIPYSVVQIDNILYSALGRDALQNLGKLIRPSPQANGFKAIRGAFITAAAEAGPEGWTLVDVLQQFPTQSIDLNAGDLLTLRKNLAVYLGYNEAVVTEIQAQAAATAAKQAPVRNLTELQETGPHSFERSTITLSNSALGQTSQGLQLNYEFSAETYLPQGLSAPAPVVIISHGFGDIKDSFDFLAAHLASHGFAVMIPDHVGSDLSIRQNFLQGRLNTILSPTEFVSRPREVSLVIDELEQLVETSPAWAAKVDVEKVGIVGDSLGATTVLATAGADINFERIEQGCDRDQFILNLSQYLVCQARFLPPRSQQLSDPRVKGAIASHAMGCGLYGPEGFGQIEIPLMIVSGSRDIVAPTVSEQVHPFIWAGSQQKYLALLSEGTHFTSKPGRAGAIGGALSFLVGQHRDVGTRYFKALNVAFWNVHLKEQASYRPYLSARYGQQVSEGEPISLDIVQSLTPESLRAAYGQETPIAIVPDPINAVAASLNRGTATLADISQTGVLTVALRQDSSPFGYVSSGSNWEGYCRTLASDLRVDLEQQLGIRIQLVELPSNAGNRYTLVKDDAVHAECGPNTIRSDVEGIAFSTPLLVSGTQLLTQRTEPADPDKLDQTNLQTSGARIAVVPETAAEALVTEEFPNARRVLFGGPVGRSNAIRALAEGKVDAVASPGILSLGELERQQLPLTDFVLSPARPLKCEFYSLVLPGGDAEWQAYIDNFIDRTNAARLQRELPASFVSNQADTVDFCLNQTTE